MPKSYTISRTAAPQGPGAGASVDGHAQGLWSSDRSQLTREAPPGPQHLPGPSGTLSSIHLLSAGPNPSLSVDTEREESHQVLVLPYQGQRRLHQEESTARSEGQTEPGSGVGSQSPGEAHGGDGKHPPAISPRPGDTKPLAHSKARPFTLSDTPAALLKGH